jgi:hypothetical protein
MRVERERVMDGAKISGPVVVNARGPARASDLVYARRKIGAVQRLASRRVLAANVDLVVHEELGEAQRLASVEAELRFDGTVVRARASAATIVEAVDLLERLLGQEIQRATG